MKGKTKVPPTGKQHKIEQLGSTSVTFLHPMPIFDALRQTFTPLKASQKLGIGREWFGAGCKTVYEIDPWLHPIGTREWGDF